MKLIPSTEEPHVKVEMPLSELRVLQKLLLTHKDHHDTWYSDIRVPGTSVIRLSEDIADILRQVGVS